METSTSKVSPGSRWTTSLGRASGSVARSIPIAARKGSTGGSAISSPGIMGMLGSIGGMRQPLPMAPVMWAAWSIS